MTEREQAADHKRRTHQQQAGVTNPVPWHALKPSEQTMWLTRTEQKEDQTP